MEIVLSLVYALIGLVCALLVLLIAFVVTVVVCSKCKITDIHLEVERDD